MQRLATRRRDENLILIHKVATVLTRPRACLVFAVNQELLPFPKISLSFQNHQAIARVAEGWRILAAP